MGLAPISLVLLVDLRQTFHFLFRILAVYAANSDFIR